MKNTRIQKKKKKKNIANDNKKFKSLKENDTECKQKISNIHITGIPILNFDMEME